MLSKRLLPAGRLDASAIFGASLSLVTLAIVIYYGYLVSQQPDYGFYLDSETGEVIHLTYACAAGEQCLKYGDKVRKIGSVEFEEYSQSRTVAIYDAFKSGAPVPIEVERGQEVFTIHRQAVAETRGRLAGLSSLLFPLLFWVSGTTAVIFLRPRDARWLLLVLFHYDTAIWFSAGFLSAFKVAYSAVVFQNSLWWFLPLSVHLHLVLPDSPFKKYHRWLLPPLYLLTLYLVVQNELTQLPRVLRLGWALMGMILALGLLVLRLLLPSPSTGPANRVMLYGLAMGLGPIILMVLLYLVAPATLLTTSFLDVVGTISLLIIPLWPSTYIYAIYRYHWGALEFRANRLLGGYGFFVLYITAYIVIFNIAADPLLTGELDPLLFGLILSLIFVVSGPPVRLYFQQVVDRYVFDLRYQPNEIVEVFAEKIPTAFNRRFLRRVIEDEILPTLLIRKSALYVIADGEIETIYEQGLLGEEGAPDVSELAVLLSKAGQYISPSPEAGGKNGWIRVVVPLSIQVKTIGAWLLGRRDPDDYYTKSDVSLLGNLANQMAPVIENFRLVEKAREEVAENKRLQQQLIHSQKMEAIGRLSAGVAHDFNNILSVIIGYSNLILAQYREDKSLQQSIKNIQDAGERAAGLTKQLLAFSRQQVMEAKVTDVNAIVADVEKMLRRLAGEDIELVTDLGSDLPAIKIDPGQMGQVIINLAVNARDAMPDGGRIRIETRGVTCGEESGGCRDNVPPGNYVLLRVKDTGAGIEPEIQTRMFEPYFTTKDLGKGTGLGLSMVYGIINQSRGHIFVNSDIGKGATFSVYLPAVSEEEVRKKRLADTGARLDAGTETILLVEDEQSVRAVASEILQASGYTVIEARDGEEALRDFERQPEEIDLLLTDVVMPRMKGPELAERLVTAQPRLKVIFMSGYNEESILGRRIGGDGSILIQKPFSPLTLARKVREVLDREAVPARPEP
jgi:signal transduction histidine kinase